MLLVPVARAPPTGDSAPLALLLLLAVSFEDECPVGIRKKGGATATGALKIAAILKVEARFKVLV